MITKSITMKFKEQNCSHCKLCDKKAMVKGLPHCKSSMVSIRNGVCEQKEGK